MSQNVRVESDGDEFSYADESPFTKLFETKSRVKILDTLVRYSYEPLTQQELEDLANVHQSSVSRNKNVLLDIGIVEEVGSNPVKYQLNQDDPRTELLKRFHRQMSSDAGRLQREDVESQREEVERQCDLTERYEGQSDDSHLGSSLAVAQNIRNQTPLVVGQ
ncbi:winged helix-turn-helix domain-containing protein [Salinigranum sp. GCM10025319]|uniref:winged helix-turn-helix domain-containing protein n=1 Tax=Salinigranum sp. GCM10025319 TaxID=3252687 RepID=UPI00360A2318